MAHAALCGMTESGKSHLAAVLARRLLGGGRHVLYYDPLGNPFPCSWRTSDPFALLDKAKRATNCAIFIDEAVDILTNRAEHAPLVWLATQSRHHGHRCFFIGQDFAKIAPIYRRNCSVLYLFRVLPSTARVWADEFADPELLRAATLPQHNCLFKTHWHAGKPAPVLQFKAPAR